MTHNFTITHALHVCYCMTYGAYMYVQKRNKQLIIMQNPRSVRTDVSNNWNDSSQVSNWSVSSCLVSHKSSLPCLGKLWGPGSEHCHLSQFTARDIILQWCYFSAVMCWVIAKSYFFNGVFMNAFIFTVFLFIYILRNVRYSYLHLNTELSYSLVHSLGGE